MERFLGRSYHSLQEERRQRLENNQEEDEEEFIDYGGPHRHCYFCYSFTLCNMRNDTDQSCDFTTCSLGCGAIFHGCKMEEHLELCPNLTVPCLNAVNGCPKILPRRLLGVHLEICPASVIVCMAEWNRWPVFSSERKKNVPFRQSNPHAEPGQLDYDLAMRDQRMLRCLDTLPRETKIVLRNNLTRRFPAVPISSVSGKNEMMSKRKEVDPNNNSINNNTLHPEYDVDIGENFRKMEEQLMKQRQIMQEDLKSRLKGQKVPPKYWEFPELEKGNIHPHCANCFNIHCKYTHLNILAKAGEKVGCGMIDCKFGCGAIFHVCKTSEHQMICTRYGDVDTFDTIYRGKFKYHADGTKELLFLPTQTKKFKEQTKSKEPKDSIGDLFFGPGETANTQLHHKIKGKQIPNPPNISKKKDILTSSLHLDIRLEVETRLQPKHKAMYTFVCAQLFRRDEYQWHSKNVHDDILGGMNNWLEQRCPLASYGCGFSVRRMYPNFNQDYKSSNFVPFSTIIFSPSVESFGTTSLSATFPVRKQIEHKKKKKKPMSKTFSVPTKSIKNLHLTDLPFDVLYPIIDYLDSFSICNLAVTCSYLRYICCSLLDDRGCVSLKWERSIQDGKISWDVAYKQWFFSTAMDPIKGWMFHKDIGSISEHLKTCPYNVRTFHTNHEQKGKDPKWDILVKSLKQRLELKRRSEWFV